MLLVISLVIALLPLIGVVWIGVQGSLATVDGLFTSLILLAISGTLGLNVLLALRKKHPGGSRDPRRAPARVAVAALGVDLTQRGRVESVQFFEATVGLPNKSFVSLSNGTSGQSVLVFEGDMRNALPVGQKLEITFRKEPGHNVLLAVNQA